MVIAAPAAHATLDGDPVESLCEETEIPGAPWRVYRCALSQPLVTSGNPATIDLGVQHDGPHTLRADQPVGAFVFGFDSYKGYAYPAGMNVSTLR